MKHHEMEKPKPIPSEGMKLRDIIFNMMPTIAEDSGFPEWSVGELDKAETQIKEWVKSKMPEYKENQSSGREYTEYPNGWNAYREQFIKNMEDTDEKD